jgi:hypothetical protein
LDKVRNRERRETRLPYVLGIGVSPANLERYRDDVLGVLVIAREALRFGPAFFLAEHQAIPAAVIYRAVIGLGAAVAISLISPNWNLLLN